jgi:thiol:disulfide interchange protein DsbD
MTMSPGKWSKFVLACALAIIATVASAQEKAHWTISAPGNAKPGDVVNVDLKASIDSGWHLYGLVKTIGDGPTPTTITATGGATIAGKITEDKPIKKLDPNFDLVVEYFEGSTVFHVPVKLGPKGLNDSLKVGFQTCNATTCIPPLTLEVPLSGKAALAVPAAPTNAGPQVLHHEETGGMLAFIGSAFIAGLLALLTPCVFPMVPITVSFFTKRQQTLGKRAGLGHALAYCGGIISAYTAFGLIATALFGASGIQRFAANPWVNAALAVIFLLLALNLFGILQMNLPSGLQNTFNPHGKSGLLAPLLMGLTFTLTSFTCTGPFVGTILVSAAGGNYLYPLIGMLVFSSAFASPFFLLALFPQYLARLPKSGAWLDMVKAFMGFLEIAAAVKFLSNADLVLQTNLISRGTFLVVWTVILAASVVFLLGWFRLGKVEIPEKLGPGRIIVVALTTLTCIALASAVTGRSLGELEAFLPPTHSKEWTDDYSKAVALARRTGRPILINFTGVTCTNCRWMEKNMFPRDDVRAQLKNYVLVELYTDRQKPSDVANGKLEQQLTGSVTLPVYTAVSPEGKVLTIFPGSTRVSSEFVNFLRAGLKGS